MTSAWDAVADRYEAHLDVVAAVLESGGEVPDWDPGDELPSHPPAPDELARLRALDDRSRRLADDVRTEMSRLRDELAESGQRRSAARAYRRGAGARPVA